MKIRIKLITIFFIYLVIGSGILTGAVQGGENRPTISADERALAMWEVQFLMSKHAYYYQANLRCEEMEDIFVSENGPYAETATWTSEFGVEGPMSQLKYDYCTLYLEEEKANLERFSKTHPEVENKPENLGIGAMYGSIHTNLTPIIEIAGDGKTAKGVWYSIGMMGNNMSNPEKYAADFVKEDGEWKIWHFMNLSRQPIALNGSREYPEELEKPYGARGVLPGEDPTTTVHIHNIFKIATDLDIYDPKVVPKIFPKFPEPYYTFSETFSY